MSFPPSDPVYGNDCLTCYPAGKTPLFMYASFSQIKMGDLWLPAHGSPPNNIYQLTQTVANPCRWELLLGGGRSVRYTVSPGLSMLVFVAGLARTAFYSAPLFNCIRFHDNDFDTPVNTFFWDGVAFVFTPWEIQDKIEEYTIVVDPDPQMNVHPVPGEQVVIQYTDQWGDTNVKMLVDLPL